MKTFFVGFCFALHFWLVVLCYLPYLNTQISGAQLPILGGFTLFLPLLLALHLASLLLWFVSKKYKTFLVFLVLSIGLYKPFTSFVHFNLWQKKSAQNPYKILSLNTRYFREGMEPFKLKIQRESPDFILLQEVKKEQAKDLAQNLDYQIAQFPYVCILSKYKIEKSAEIFDQTSNGHACYAEVNLDGQRLKIINTYLEPFYLDQKDQRFHLKEPYLLKKELLELLKKLKRGFEYHTGQLSLLEPHIKDQSAAVILGGDLNSVPFSSEYLSISNHLQDLFPKAGVGFSTSYSTPYFPLRIDYFFGSKKILAQKYSVEPGNFSDHKPIVLEFAIQP
ncbi:MAG: hypothetical protein C4K58_05050 [Flavobacteriaceae bacterium]|nr:MAG: hypothetical protein C4K58_05050 [Flavobacteriaceae bacterium]